MNYIRIRSVAGKVLAPPSKSLVQRYLAAALLCTSETVVAPGPLCEDARAALELIIRLGARVQWKGDRLLVTGNPPGLWSRRRVHCGESGLLLRMTAALAATSPAEVILTGKGTLRRRTLSPITGPLGALQVSCTTRKGGFPLRVSGCLVRQRLDIYGGESSQFLSGLLMGLPLLRRRSTRVRVSSLQSRPYIDLTLEVMKRFGIRVFHREYREFVVPGGQRYLPPPATLQPEGDFSAAAFLLVAGAVGGEVTVSGIHGSSNQGDREVLAILRQAGARVSVTPDGIRVTRNQLRNFRCNAMHCPDLFPPLAALASHCTGTSVIRGVHRLTNKESNRARTLQNMLRRMGITAALRGDDLVITGGRKRYCRVDSAGDHRVAMAAAVTAVGSPGGVLITRSQAVRKSYPGFFRDLASLEG